MNTIRPLGALTMNTVVSQMAVLDDIEEAGSVTIDLSGVTDVDSAAVALLIAWYRTAQMRQIRVTLTAIPERLSRLLAVYGLTEILSLAA